MPHQCVRCGSFYDDGASEILKGCNCGGKLFFYVKKDKLKEVKAKTVNLSTEQKEEIEKDVFELVGSDASESQPVVLDFEAIRILKPGQYELDLVHLFKDEPLIFKLDDGKYMIDLLATMKAMLGKKKKK
jgi:predicted  nucleic acid-binding Zn-ribbon protein